MDRYGNSVWQYEKLKRSRVKRQRAQLIVSSNMGRAARLMLARLELKRRRENRRVCGKVISAIVDEVADYEPARRAVAMGCLQRIGNEIVETDVAVHYRVKQHRRLCAVGLITSKSRREWESRARAEAKFVRDARADSRRILRDIIAHIEDEEARLKRKAESARRRAEAAAVRWAVKVTLNEIVTEMEAFPW